MKIAFPVPISIISSISFSFLVFYNLILYLHNFIKGFINNIANKQKLESMNKN